MKEDKTIVLTELPVGILARVEKIADVTENTALENTALERLSQRLQAMGILRDRPIEVLRRSQFGGPLHIRAGQTTELAIRQQEAALIIVRVMN